jgi:hypothetical protein
MDIRGFSSSRVFTFRHGPMDGRKRSGFLLPWSDSRRNAATWRRHSARLQSRRRAVLPVGTRGGNHTGCLCEPDPIACRPAA